MYTGANDSANKKLAVEESVPVSTISQLSFVTVFSFEKNLGNYLEKGSVPHLLSILLLSSSLHFFREKFRGSSGEKKGFPSPRFYLRFLASFSFGKN